ncbi:NAD(P)-dependent oxidoreductase [Methylobacterium oryzisoli]|uniref:NAD(P)-dependent oxidoreductase n=1 Tax=Methylobacterium oryzisoli TaxID=3385502 RepID=UPI003892C616
MAHVLIIGASQGIGLATVRASLKQGHRVRAFARTASRIPITHERLEKVDGDARHEGDVAQALSGIDVVIQALGVPARELFHLVTLFSEATQVLVRAMEAADVSRLIAVTGFGAGDSRAAISLLHLMPFQIVFGRAYDDKDVQEMIIRTSSLAWTIVRPGILTNSRRASGYMVLGEPASWKGGFISRSAVADFLVRQIENRQYVGRTPVLIQ